MRAIAISMVVLSHALYVFQGYDNALIDGMQVIGVQGVEVFFVLSGFLIGGILLKLLQSTSFSINEVFHFWIRRWFRTLPLYFLMLCIKSVFSNAKIKLMPRIHEYFLFTLQKHILTDSF